MFLVRTTLGPSSIHGIGAFAGEPVRKGQVVWQFDPRVDLRFPASELHAFPPAMQEHLRIRCYVEMYQGQKVMVLCADNSQYVNHSSDPNLVDSEDGLVEVAARDIAAGEELTCNYYASDLAVYEKLGEAPVEA
jgi:uncharacterized protein